MDFPIREHDDPTDGREVKGAAMRARLRAATEASIAEVGVTATSAVTIAQRCNVSRGALLHHYPTREDLIIDTATHFWRRQRETVTRLNDELGAGRLDTEAFIRRLYDEVFRANALVMMLDLMISGRSETRVGEAVDGILVDLFHFYGKLGQQAFAVAGLAPERVRVLITLIVSALRGLRIQQNIDHDEARVHAVLAMLTEAVDGLIGLEPKPAVRKRGRP